MPESLVTTALIGYRASGKTTLGERVAARLACAFTDLDDRVLARLGEETVRSAWVARGEAAWREAETEALEELMGTASGILALGGGVPMIAGARALVESAQSEGRLRVVWLACDAATLSARLETEPGDRPTLVGDDPASEVAVLLPSREPVYADLADARFDTGQVDLDEATTALASLIRGLG